MIRRLLKSDRLRAVACWLGAQYIRLVWLTGRWRVENDALPRQMWADGRPFILAFWHGNLMMMTQCWDRRQPMHMLISQHRDGQIIARIIGHFGLGAVAGSSSNGGANALRQIFRALKSGECIGITPDGPRGPRMRASDGIVGIARLSGVPIIPCAVATRRRVQLRSWDRFQVALPLSAGLICWGDPITVDKDLDAAGLEAKRLEIETALTALAHAVEIRMGHTPTEPEPPGPPRQKSKTKKRQEPTP